MPRALHIKGPLSIPRSALRWKAVRASGPGGQHVNTTDSAVELRVDLGDLDMPDSWRARILAHNDRRITGDGDVVVQAREHRSQKRNRDAAEGRLVELLREALHVDPPRRRTRPSLSSRRRAVKKDQRRREIKAGRKKPQI